MKLTKAQKAVLERMKAAKWETAQQIGCNIKTLIALGKGHFVHSRGWANPKWAENPRLNLEWIINGFAYEELKRDNKQRGE